MFGSGNISARTCGFVWVLIAISVPLGAQVPHRPTTIRRDVHHDVSLPLIDLMRKTPATSQKEHEAEPVHSIPLPQGLRPLREDPVRQSRTLGFTPLVSDSFDGLGQGKYGFTVEFAPPDTNGAVGQTQYVQWVNTYFAIFDKSTGGLLAGPSPGNALWSGFGGSCETHNDGDPVVVYDKFADRWVMSQLELTVTPYMLCIAVSTSPDATGTWNRYAFQYGSDLDDYPKMGVWPDAYYETFNMFLNGQSFVGADACAFDRVAMLTGQAATQICFQQSWTVGGLLPADVDGIAPPPPGSPNYLLNYGTNSLNLFKFHVDFGNPSNSTFTGPTVITVAAFSPLCGGGRDCVPQPGTSNALDSLADRLMYRLAYRNFGDHESLVVNHSVAVNGGGGVRWYEIRSPGGTPVVAQQGTYAPDASYRWMGSIAMDKAGDIALGYSVSSSAVYPSIAIAGRVPTDPAGALETETAVIGGSGSQTATLTRWGDYSSMTVDPADDCTFWYTQEYIVTNGSWNWNTRIANFKFPGCSTGAYVALFPTSLSFGGQNVGTSSGAQQVTLSNHQGVSLAISSISVSGDYLQSTNCGASVPANGNCTINLTFHPTATGTRTGTLTVASNGPNSPQTASLTGLGTEPANCVHNSLSDGGFESGTLNCWTLGGVLLPSISTWQAHGGSFSALLGATGLPEPNGDSSLYQTITVPSSAVSPALTFWYWPWTSDTIQYDWQEAQIRNSSGTMLAQIFKAASNAQTWTQVTYDLTPYRGQTIQIYFNVHEDGFDDQTYMYLDDVAITNGSSPPLQFVPVSPCRIADTRTANGTFGGPSLQSGATRSFPVPQQTACNIPSAAAAYSLNVTVVPHGTLGFLSAWPAGQPQPQVSTVNSWDGRIKANAAIVPAGASGAVSVFASNTTDVVLDIDGYFEPATASTLLFYPLAPCRVADTRNATGSLGGPYLHANQTRDFPVRAAAACHIPSSAQAYSLNLTAIPRRGALWVLSAWPAGHSQPNASTLNAPTGTVVANAALIPAGTNGDIDVSASNDTDLVIDINGYFAPAGAGGLSLYASVPCRTLDTRQGSGAFRGRLVVNVVGGPCGVASSAQAYVFNATVVPTGPLGLLSLWPDGLPQTQASSLNSWDAAVTSNMAIVPTTNGSIDAYVSSTTQLILDLSSYFAP
ncbi:MAG: choice-of-anchor D domain-containing protein [Candidatus Korobacteraceae bacterium]